MGSHQIKLKINHHRDPAKIKSHNKIKHIMLGNKILRGEMKKFLEKLFQGSIKVLTETQGFVPADHQNLSDKLSRG